MSNGTSNPGQGGGNKGGGPPDNFAKLTDLLGFDPTRESPTKGVLTKALEKITEERDEALQKKLEEQLKKAIDLAQRKKKLDGEYKTQSNKWNKELGKMLNQLFAVQQGKEPPPEEEEDDEEKKKEGDE